MIGARASFCAAHRLPSHSGLHGHSYEVWAYTKYGDAELWQKALHNALRSLDHTILPKNLSTMENIARWVCKKLHAKKVCVIRPVEGLCAEYRVED